MTAIPAWAADVVAELPHPVVFATVSGAHLYGFESVDSDLDLRASHILPLPSVVGLTPGPQTLQAGGFRDGVELDVVSQELAKFIRLMLKPNGYVLEQLLSPLVVTTTALHAALVSLAPGCLTAGHAHHYLGFAASQWRLFEKTGHLKPALYTLRVLHTGIHLMRTGEIVADLPTLNTLPYVPDLIAAKRLAEHGTFPSSVVPLERVAADVDALTTALEAARDTSALPRAATAGDALNSLLVETRMAGATPPRAS